MKIFSKKSLAFSGIVGAAILISGVFVGYGSINKVGEGLTVVKPVESPVSLDSFNADVTDEMAKRWENFSPVEVNVIGADENPDSFSSDVKESFVLVAATDSDIALLDEANVEKVSLFESSDKNVVAVPADVAEALNLSGSVEKNIRISTLNNIQEFPPSWGQDRIDTENYMLDNLFNFDTTGKGVTVYIIDTGINVSHNDFSGRLKSGFSTVNDGRGWDDCNGHGTHVAGTVGGARFGVAKEVAIVPVRVLNCTGSGYVSDIISGLNWIVSNHVGGPAVINMSLGGGYSQILNDAVNNTIRSGFHVVVAAGNSSSDACNFSPASTPAALTVAATGRDDVFASYSNRGSCVDISAPGSSIVSAYVGSSNASATLSGTSMAAPHVTAAVARILQNNPSASPSQISSIINDYTAPVVKSVPPRTTNKIIVLVVEEPAVEEPAVEEPAVEEPAVEEPAVEEPAVEEPAVEEPTVEEPKTPGRGNGGGNANRPSRNAKSLETVDFDSFTIEASTSETVLLSWQDTRQYNKVIVTILNNEGFSQTFEVKNGLKTLTISGLTPNTRYLVEGQGFGSTITSDFSTNKVTLWFITREPIANSRATSNVPPVVGQPNNRSSNR